VKIASKFIKKFEEHVNENSLPKEIPTFARAFFVPNPDGGFRKTTTTPEMNATANGKPAAENSNALAKPKADSKDPSAKEKKKQKNNERA
jgi:hypothetical protein